MSTFDTCYIKCQNPSRLLRYMHTICMAKCVETQLLYCPPDIFWLSVFNKICLGWVSPPMPNHTYVSKVSQSAADKTWIGTKVF